MSAQEQYLISSDNAIRKYVETGGTVVIGDDKIYELTPRNSGSANIAWGSRVQFYLNNIADAIARKFELRIEMAAVATTGGSPTNVRLTNACALHMFSNIRFLSSSSSVTRDVDPRLFRAWIIANTPVDEVSTVNKYLGVDTSANRVTKSAATQVFRVPIEWLYRYFQQMPLSQIADNQICFEFTLQPSAAAVVEYGGTAPTTISANINLMALRVITDICPSVDRLLRSYSERGTEVAMYGLSKGLLYEGNDFLTKSYSVVSGTTTTALDIPELSDKLVKAIMISCHLDTDIAAKNYDNYQSIIQSFQIKSGSSIVDGTDNIPITKDAIDYSYIARHVPGVDQLQGSNLIFWGFSSDFDRDMDDRGMPGFNGAYDYSGITNQRITLNMTSALAANHTILVHVVYARRDVLVNGLFTELYSMVRKA